MHTPTNNLSINCYVHTYLINKLNFNLGITFWRLLIFIIGFLTFFPCLQWHFFLITLDNLKQSRLNSTNTG
jgi:hypothetical protein